MSRLPVDWSWDLANDVLDHVAAWYTARIADLTLGAESKLPAMQFVSEGLPAWDCDLMTIYLERSYPTTGDSAAPTPTPDGTVRFKLGAQMRLILIRCAALSASELDPIPSTSEMEASARIVHRDMPTVINALTDGVKTGALPGCKAVVFNDYTQLGPDGGFVGGAWSFFIARA